MKGFIDAIRREFLGMTESQGYIGKVALPVSADPAISRSTIYLIDQSGSMAAEDISPDRYSAASQAVQTAMTARRHISQNDIASVILFNSTEHIVCESVPIGKACQVVPSKLDKISPDGGTYMSSGLKAAFDIFAGLSVSHAMHLVVLSDGHDGGRPSSLAENIKSHGVLVDCIGVGRAPSDVDEKCLKRIASVVDGVVRYRFITNAADLVDHFESISTGICKKREKVK